MFLKDVDLGQVVLCCPYILQKGLYNFTERYKAGLIVNFFLANFNELEMNVIVIKDLFTGISISQIHLCNIVAFVTFRCFVT